MDAAVSTPAPPAVSPPSARGSLRAAIVDFLSGDGRSAGAYDDSWAAAAPVLPIATGPERAPG